MPIYEYVCSACDHRADILHGRHDPGPHFCPACGKSGTMRKTFAPPAIVFKGTGWARKDRAASTRSATKSSARAGEDGSGGSSEGARQEGAGKPAGGSSSSGESNSSGESSTGSSKSSSHDD
ncbi:MAG TPA: FmdB family zinc ribbon protein [Candidatus Limnocylindrales bacterium]